MWLINTSTLELELILGRPPPFAILSHTWSGGEVSMQDFRQPAFARQLSGYDKILRTCEMAREAGIGHAWVDTCCIDKTSSADLSEAINSMFAFYRDAQVAYAWLADWTPRGKRPGGGEASGGEDDEEIEAGLRKCRWFTRGWTLQELIAPRELHFFDSEWNLRGTKAGLSDVLASITGVEPAVLRDSSLLPTIPVARRMSWAASRKTTREEDMAYSLLGVFDVNMPMMYGEGARAFIRLQEAIMAEVNDLTLFAWRAERDGPEAQEYRGILARSPAEFAAVGRVELDNAASYSADFRLTNKGVQFKKLFAENDGDTIMALDCTAERDGRGHNLGIYVTKHGASAYLRSQPWRLAESDEWVYKEYSGYSQVTKPQKFFVGKNISRAQSEIVVNEKAQGRAIRLGDWFDSPYLMISMLEPKTLLDESGRQFLTQGLSSFAGLAMVMGQSGIGTVIGGRTCYVLWGFDKGQEAPWASVVDPMVHMGMYGAFNNISTLPALAKNCMNSHVVLEDLVKQRGADIDATVSVQEKVIGGAAVHEVNLQFIAEGFDYGRSDSKEKLPEETQWWQKDFKLNAN